MRYDIEVIDLVDSGREENLGRFGGRRAITQTLFLLTFLPYFVPNDLRPALFRSRGSETNGAVEREQATENEATVSREDLYVKQSLDALFPPSSSLK